MKCDLIIFVFCTKIRAILCYCKGLWDENNLSHIDNEEISAKVKKVLTQEMISTYCGKATSYKRYHHHHTLEDLTGCPKA